MPCVPAALNNVGSDNMAPTKKTKIIHGALTEANFATASKPFAATTVTMTPKTSTIKINVILVGYQFVCRGTLKSLAPLMPIPSTWRPPLLWRQGPR